MLKRLLLLIAALASVALYGRELRAAVVDVQLFPLSGEVRLFNPNSTPFDFVYYELKSGANAFIAPASWTSIADTYDASGNGFVDPVNQWIELSATSSMLAEGLFVGSGSALPAYRSIGLGAVWGPEVAKPNDVDANVFDANNQLVPVNVYISLLGDYNRDLVVDASITLFGEMNSVRSLPPTLTGISTARSTPLTTWCGATISVSAWSEPDMDRWEAPFQLAVVSRPRCPSRLRHY